MNELLFNLLIQTQGSVLVFLGILGMHAVVLQYGTYGGRRGLRTAAAYLVACDWALVMGVTAGRSVAGEGVPFWSLHTVMWGLLGVLLLFLPAWLLFRFGLRFCGIFFLPVMPTNPEQRKQAGCTLRAYMWGLNYPFYREEDGELRKLVDGRVRLRQGGPGFVTASSHYAIPITAGTHDTRVEGQGLVFTGRKERPRSLVDLRLQVRAKEVHALTRDGIPIKVMMFAIFEIDRRGAKGEGLYPFNPQAVFAAVHAQGVGPEQDDEEREEIGWDQVVVDRAADLLRGAIARVPLDRLLEGGSGDASPPRETLRTEVTEKLAQVVKPLGVHILAVGMGNVEGEDEEVSRQMVEIWRAHWERRRVEREAEGDAEAIRIIEEARADAQRQMIVAITEAFQQLADTQTPLSAHVIALRLIDVLEEMAESPVVQKLLPETVSVIPAQLRLLMEHTAASGGGKPAQ